MNTKTIKQVLLVFALMIGAITLFSSIAPSAFAYLGADENPVADLTGGETSLKALILRIVNYFLTFLGILAVIMVIYGGVTYVTSAGSDEATGNAKKIIMYALIGIIVILLSFVVVNAILGAGATSGAV